LGWSKNHKISVTGAGYPAEFYADALSILVRGHVRVGLEDSIFNQKRVLAAGNAQLVEKEVRIARELGCEIASRYWD
jgi:3-keto-5-aminohexanoate cleavage enzyme